jgi:osmotically-inducible protein OsmY
MKKLALVVGLLFGISGVMVHAQGYPSSSQPDQTSPQTSGQQPDSTMQQQPSSSQQSPASATQAQASVQKALQQDPALSSAVSAQAGSDNKLVLSGTVPTQADKDRAEQMARSAAGGMTIDNQIQVSGSSTSPGSSGSSTTPPSTPPHGNSFMASDAAQTGSQKPDQSSTGQTGQTPDQSTAGQSSTGQAGSQSSTGSQSSSGMSSGQGAQSQIQAAIQQQPALSGVTVSETDKQIELSGTVAKASDKKDAKKIADQYASGKKVVDHITVGQSK